MISVIIPAFNEEKNLKRLLPHLKELSAGHQVEIIVSIGDCTGDYDDCVDGLGNVKLIAKRRKGRAKQMNDGAAMAKGNVLVFLHADVTPPKGFYGNIKETLANNYDAGFFSYRFDRDNFLLRMNASFTKRDGIFTGGGDQCLFIKKETFDKLGGFNDNQVLMEDFEFFSRMKKAKIPYRIVQNDLVVSARKYQNNSYLRVNLSNLALLVLFRLGCQPKKLHRLHENLLR